MANSLIFSSENDSDAVNETITDKTRTFQFSDLVAL